MTGRRARASTALRHARLGARTVPDLVIEGAWLAGIVLLPLVFNPRDWLSFYNDPKYLALHVTGFVVVTAWVWEWALHPGQRPLLSVSRVRAWASRSPARWAVIAAGLLALSVVVSTGLSPVRAVSLWGRDFTDLGYELYSFLALLAVFFAIAFRMRSVAQVRRLLLTMAATGTVAALYGIAQRFDWDPLGPGDGAGRVFASFGNPILLGSFLVMSAAVTAAVAVAEDRGRRRGWLVAGSLALGLQLAALWFTGSRGPWIGYVAGAAAFVAMGWWWLDRRIVSSGLSVIGTGAGIAIVIALVPGADDGRERGLDDLGSVFDDSPAGSLGGRGPIWESVLDLSIDRSWEPGESAGLKLVRPLAGYGPEMFAYAYPLGVEVERSGTVALHAHNFPLQLLAELGLLGLGSFAALVILAGYAAVRTINVVSTGGDRDGWPAIVIVGLLAAMVGRGLEQMAGVARVGDLLPFWALVGALIAVVEIASASRDVVSRTPDTRDERRTGPRRPRRSPVPSARLASLALASGVSALAIVVIYTRDVEAIRASAIARDGLEFRQEGQPNEALAKYQQATDLAPEVELYHLQLNDLFRQAAAAAESAGSNDEAIVGWRGALLTAQRYADLNPKAFDTQSRMAQAESRLAGLGVAGAADDARERYLAIGAARPSFPAVQTEAALGLLSVGEDALGLEYAERALAMETADDPNAEAWWLRGVALENLDSLEAAALSYETAIQRGPDSDAATGSHLGLARIYDALGDTERAERERELGEAER